MVLVLSVFNWQHAVMQYQFVLQILLVFIIISFVFKTVLRSWRQTQAPVVFSIHGDWLETNIDGQVVWKMTNKSRVTTILLFIHLISPLKARDSKWCLIYKDQVNKRDFRRLCRAVIYQQHTSEEN
ncbi:MAG: hypothetical protein ACJASL_001898 [Paraglaciecola sp.]|jgi:hypothetical protein